jgi:hypothetical protein
MDIYPIFQHCLGCQCEEVCIYKQCSVRQEVASVINFSQILSSAQWTLTLDGENEQEFVNYLGNWVWPPSGETYAPRNQYWKMFSQFLNMLILNQESIVLTYSRMLPLALRPSMKLISRYELKPNGRVPHESMPFVPAYHLSVRRGGLKRSFFWRPNTGGTSAVHRSSVSVQSRSIWLYLSKVACHLRLSVFMAWHDAPFLSRVLNPASKPWNPQFLVFRFRTSISSPPVRAQDRKTCNILGTSWWFP